MLNLSSDRLFQLKENFGEAFYLFDSDQFASNFKELKEAFSSIYPHFNIAYSYKTNYLPKIGKIVDFLGGYAEVVSDMELEIALHAGVSYDRIIWNGPIKNMLILQSFLLNGGTVNIDSWDELQEILEIAQNNPTNVLNIGVRCNYDVGDGVISRFGFDVDGSDFNNAISLITSTPNLKLINLHCHFAKRDVKYWPARAKGMIDVIEKIGCIPERVDIGGGLFGKMEDALKCQFSTSIPSYKEYAEAAASVFAEYFKDKAVQPELLIEPGSALVGDCLKYVCIIKTIKNIRGKVFATISGSQKNISMSGVNPPISIISAGQYPQQEYKDVDLVGYTCIEGDVIYHNYKGFLAKEDFVIINNCGSYSIVMKPPFILTNVPILDICNGDVEVLKRQETFKDLFSTYTF